MTANVCEERICDACKWIFKPVSNRQKTCLECTPDKSWRHRWRRYGITKPEFDSIFAKQNGKCPLCGIELKLDINTCIDHCHDSEIVRGILCRGCNMVLARFEDENYMDRVEKYLDDFSLFLKEVIAGRGNY